MALGEYPRCNWVNRHADRQSMSFVGLPFVALAQLNPQVDSELLDKGQFTITTPRGSEFDELAVHM